MLQLNTIREEKDRVLSGLKKRNFKELHLIDNIIALDEKRRATQLSLDETLAKSNNLFKEIGNLFKAGETDKVNALKEQTATLKEDIKLFRSQHSIISLFFNDIFFGKINFQFKKDKHVKIGALWC